MFLKSKKHSMESGKIISWKAEIYIMDFNLLTSIHKTPDEQGTGMQGNLFPKLKMHKSLKITIYLNI